MKKWFKPQVQELGLEMTLGNGDHHFCHAPEGKKCDGVNGGKDHNGSDNAKHQWTGVACLEDHGFDKGNSDCCCYDPLAPPTPPGKS